MDLVKTLEEQVDQAQEAHIEATQASIAADARLRAAEVTLQRLREALRALKGESAPAPEPKPAPPVPENDALAQRKPVHEDEEAPPPASAGPACPSCGARGQMYRTQRTINGRMATMIACGKCGSEKPG